MPYVEIAKKQRGLRFFHPVEVEFLSDADFTKEVTSKEEDLTDEDREEIEQATGMLRAIGLIDGDVDLFEEVDRCRGGSVIGLYSFEDEHVRIRGTKIDPAVKSTLVHELVHALQDQHFDIGKHREELAEGRRGRLQRDRLQRPGRGRRLEDRDGVPREPVEEAAGRAGPGRGQGVPRLERADGRCPRDLQDAAGRALRAR